MDNTAQILHALPTLPRRSLSCSCSDGEEGVRLDEKKEEALYPAPKNASQASLAPLTPEEKKAHRKFLFKLDACLMTWAFCAYLMKMIDTGNFRTAYASGMQEEMGFYGTELNWMDSWCRIGYAIFLIPSQLILTKIPANYWLPFAEVMWGLCTGLMAAAHNANSMYALRFLIGLFEASSYPGIIFILCNWYTPTELATRITVFSASYPVANIFTGFMQAALYTNMNGVRGLSGWRWLFIFNSITTVIVAVFGFYMIPDNPGSGKVRWLTQKEQELAKTRMDRCHKLPPMGLSWKLLRDLATNWVFYAFTFTYLSWTMSQHSNTWLILFLKAARNSDGSVRFGVADRNLIPIIGYVIQIIVMLICGYVSDRTGRRASIVAIQEVTLFIGALILSIWPASFIVKMAGYFMLYLSCAGGSILIAWMADLVPSQEERSLIVAIMITINFAVDSVAIRLTYPAKEAPHYKVGYKVPTALSALCIILCGVWSYTQHRMAARKGPESSV